MQNVELYRGSGWFLDIVGCRGWWPTGDGAAVRSQLGIAGATLPQHISTSWLLYLNISQHLGYFTSTYLNVLATLPQHISTSWLLYLNISQHLGYFTSTYPTQHRKNRPSPLLTHLMFSPVNQRWGRLHLHISYILLIL